MAPHELQTALGEDTVDQLVTQTGMPRGDLLSQLSELLPGVIDKLTPNGRVPDHSERQGW
ncbi:YidB family protein [Aureimonas glaciei]|uniref:YidB family protein n=1 Tax=Aureimonas glaciei TaxID=1776957 RepID=UPI001666E66D